MSPERPRNLAASVRQRLLNRARERSEDFNCLATRYGNEFVVKGAILFELWHDAVCRATRDVDLLGFGDPAVERMQAISQAQFPSS